MQILEEAKELIGLGWCVLPCFGYKKYPDGFKWKEYQTKKATVEEWEVWAKRSDLTGICLITGKISGIVVVDVDNPDLKGKFKSDLISQTRSGGYHFFYKYTDEIRNTVKMDGAPIDFRGEGGLVVLPPSQAKKDDVIGVYKWVTSKPCAWELSCLDPVPQEVRDMLASEKPKTTTVSVNGWTEVGTPTEIAGTEEGNRNDNLFRFACKIIRQYPNDKKYCEYLVTQKNQTFLPPLTEAEVKTLFGSAEKYREPEEIAAEAATEALDYELMTNEQLIDVTRPETTSVGMEKIDRYFDWPAGFYLLCGISNVGKGFFASWLTMQFFKTSGLKSVLFSLEMPEHLVRDRCLQSWSFKTKEEYRETGPTEEAFEMLRKSIRVVEFNLYKDKTVAQFKKDFDKYYEKGYRVFVFDHMLEIEGATDNAKAQTVMQEWGKCFQETAKYHKDCWILVFTQTRIEKQYKSKKGEPKNNTVFMADVQGAKSPIQKSDVFIGLSRVVADECDTREFIVNVDKNRFGYSKFISKLFFAPDGNFYEDETKYIVSHRRVMENEDWKQKRESLSPEEIQKIIDEEF